MTKLKVAKFAAKQLHIELTTSTPQLLTLKYKVVREN